MMISNTRSWLPGLLSLVMLFALSCSGGGGNPIAPPSGLPGTDTGSDLTSGGDTGAEPGLTSGNDIDHFSQGSSSGNIALGLYDIYFDTATAQFEVVPLRGAEVTINVMKLLQPPGGDINNLKIKLIDFSQLLSDGLVTAEFTITHPINDAKLACFDTMGLLIGNGGNVFDQDPAVTYGGPDDIQLLNCDGYTRWMNPVEFTASTFFGYSEGIFGTKDVPWTASVNPYKYFSTYIGPTDDIKPYFDSAGSVTSRGVWQQNSSASREYEIQFPMDGDTPVIMFQYLILTHWALATSGTGDPIPFPQPKQFPPEANAEEAVYIIADAEGSNIFYDQASGNSGGTLVLNLTVYDWQGLDTLGGTGAFNQINSIGLGSPDGLFGGTGYLIDSGALAGSEISANQFSTTLSVAITDLDPQMAGTNEIFVAVYNQDPNGYGPFGTYPTEAHLAGYTKLYVDVTPGDPFNEPPVIEEIQGPDDVSCNDGETVYTCVATDPNEYNILTYQWELIQPPDLPLFLDPGTEDNTVTFDWSDNVTYQPGMYELWFQVSDGEFFARDKLLIYKDPPSFNMDPITADEEFTNNVYCFVEDATYQISVSSCDPDIVPFFQWQRGTGEPPDSIDPLDMNWSMPSQDAFYVFDWHGTEITDWWVVTQLLGGSPQPQLSEFYMVERVDSPAEPLLPPDGATEVNCDSIHESYILIGGEDCDSISLLERYWAVSDTDTAPTEGWEAALSEQIMIDWSVYSSGIYYVWQKVNYGEDETISDSLAVTRTNTPPEEPMMPFGLNMVQCNMVDVEYNSGDIFDCEGDPLIRQWALTDTDVPPDAGWVDFTGNSFFINFSTVVSGDYFLFQRVSDDGVLYLNSPSFAITKINTPPGTPEPPAGPEIVTCTDPIKEYDAGLPSECDVEDEITRFWGVSLDIINPPDTWYEFSGELFSVDWITYPTGMLFLFQRLVSGADDQSSLPLLVDKQNAPPTIGVPSGPTSVNCAMVDAEYFITEIIDCDNIEFMTRWYLSSSPDTQEGGAWLPYIGSTFIVDYSMVPNGDWYLFISVSDGSEPVVSDPLHIFKNNSAPDVPGIPSGLTEVTCLDSPASYLSGELTDCDFDDVLTSYFYFSTDPVTPTGGEWTEFIGGLIIIDFTGVTAEQTYYLFQKVSDGSLESMSDSLGIVYHNTPPDSLFQPSGETDVSCANNNEQYEGGPVSDCDTWQTITREYVVSIADWPPATGWIEFTSDHWTIDWSTYSENTYYMFQRAYDGFDYTYSDYLQITVGPPALVKPPTPVGSDEVDCDGSTELYEAGEYMTGCPGVDITREWAAGPNPSPPVSGWTEFFGTSFLADPVDFGFGYVYLFQRATLDLDVAYSDALIVFVHPGTLGSPPIPSGSSSVDCSSINEPYDMGTVPTGCPDTPMDRYWQIQDNTGVPQGDWVLFTSSPVQINWTIYDPGTYRLLQRANDGEHEQTSVPLVVTIANTPPELPGSITGDTDVTCADTAVLYDCGSASDCDKTQILTREWGWNTIDTPPSIGWQEMIGSSFIIDYSAGVITPGNVYLFQRVTDGIITVYGASSLHVVYTNTPPETPMAPTGDSEIDCNNVISMYDAGFAFDCDGTDLTREWGVSGSPTPPTSGWEEFVGTTFEVTWSDYGYGDKYLYQRVDDGMAAETSLPLNVTYTNTSPIINSFNADEGVGPFYTDGGLTTGYNGLNFYETLHYTFTVSDCDDDVLVNRWVLTTSLMSPPEGDPSWSDPISGTTFEIDLTDYIDEAPALLFVFLSCADGTDFVVRVPHLPVGMWERVWLIDFSDPGDMWSEDACVAGIGDYTWSYDGTNDYLRLTDYDASSSSGVWSSAIAFPTAPGPGFEGMLQAYVNPGMSDSTGLDNISFAFLNAGCNMVPSIPIIGEGCDADNPALQQAIVDMGSQVWNSSWSVGLRHNGFDGCTDSDLWIDWVGFWEKPQ